DPRPRGPRRRTARSRAVVQGLASHAGRHRQAARRLGTAVQAHRGWLTETRTTKARKHENARSFSCTKDLRVPSSLRVFVVPAATPMRVIAGSLKGRRLKTPTWDGV